ncbi:MAG: hypothetical protein HFI70_03920 [Lachnospiraceae bacterium]|nr:hypothetical protein [Lachnospiraceae bacterium]
MKEILGYNNFCAACKGSIEKNGELICNDRAGRFCGLPVKQVLLAPCMKSDYFPRQKSGNY